MTDTEAQMKEIGARNEAAKRGEYPGDIHAGFRLLCRDVEFLIEQLRAAQKTLATQIETRAVQAKAYLDALNSYDEQVRSIEAENETLKWAIACKDKQILEFSDLINECGEQLQAVRTENAELQRVAVDFINEAPMSGDYALLLASLTATVTEKQRRMVTDYHSKREALYNLLKPEAQ